ncbi:H+/Cl-antiporter ClcA [Pseudobutyrivibrio sp. YE44]|uniref:chloride channel protein n=1 Tax=Pseudobutyrivibrio sp. YE44 TaxID=1520802 RepID=UPI00088CC875|nr:chloride channel protein [Pseudobutyrivibrio sp. YE44]SDB06295.1 H+/Cl-antiporter ClcA [Pseudobutyrivibrio sp. YE44]
MFNENNRNYINEDFKKKAVHKLDHNSQRALSVVSWTLAAIIVGLAVGAFASAFGLAMRFVIKTRTTNPWLIYFLPVGAILITFIYKHVLKEKDSGTNTVIAAIQSSTKLPFRLAPLIFIATLITHLVGGSAGREGAALQMGGAIGNGIGRGLRLNETDKKTMIMCGMSAAFSALFGTPMAAAIFSMEVISVGIMHYAALVPCVISSLVARSVASYLGLEAEDYLISVIPAFNIKNAVLICIFAVLCGFVSIVFCTCLHKYEEFLSGKLTNPYIKALVGGSSVLLLTLIVGSQNYNSTGTAIIESCFTGATIGLQVFLLKIIFTTLTLSCGYKGGEIVPTLFIGATFGAAMGPTLGLPAPLMAAVGMGALFCGVTNCPISSLLICFELFGYDAMPYFLLAVAFAYWVSGYSGLYRAQKIVYSKYKSNYIDKKVQ